MHGAKEVNSVKFLKNPKRYVDTIATEMGYDSCHRIDGLNASICAKNCEEAAKSDFAKDCKKEKGFFKCCIRYSLTPA